MRDCREPLMQKAPPEAELSLQGRSGDQWPKNSHSRMITGIGTPSSHNNNPRPIASSFDRICRRENAGGEGLVPIVEALPVAGIRHRRPRLGRRLRLTLLQDL